MSKPTKWLRQRTRLACTRAIRRPGRDGGPVEAADLDVNLGLIGARYDNLRLLAPDVSKVNSWFAETADGNGSKGIRLTSMHRLMRLLTSKPQLTPLRTIGPRMVTHDAVAELPGAANSSMEPVRRALEDLGPAVEATLVADMLTLSCANALALWIQHVYCCAQCARHVRRIMPSCAKIAGRGEFVEKRQR